LWQARQEEFCRRLIYPNASFTIQTPQAMAAQRAVFDRFGLAYEVLDAAEAGRRWPQVRFEDDEALFYEPGSGAVKARESMIAVAEAFVRKGGEARIGRAVPGKASCGRLETLLINGEPLAAGAFAFACGPWLPGLMPQLLGQRIVTPRVELFFVGSPPGDLRYRWERLPNITERGLYTTSDLGGGLKLRLRQPQMTMDPDSSDRFPTQFMEHEVAAYVARRLPGLVGQPIIATYVCQVEHTDNDHYLFDRHPEFANAWIAGGGSGHAFKMGPMIGEYLADRVLGVPQAAEERALFSLASHGKAA
jgi:glycine/D-amino acid oxidase-like deaminating enzyme